MTAPPAANVPYVLVADGTPSVRSKLRTFLTGEGFRVTTAADGIDALRTLTQHPPHALVLDAALPRIDGSTVVRRLRTAGSTLPVLMLSADRSAEARVAALLTGADDVLAKPFHPAELAARLRARLRRAVWDSQRLVTFEDLRVDLLGHEVHRGQRHITLTPTEFTLLETFLNHQGQVLTRSQLYDTVWGLDVETVFNRIEVHMTSLRRKTEQGGESRLIHTVRGTGYILRPTTRERP